MNGGGFGKRKNRVMPTALALKKYNQAIQKGMY
jgi:hypothetical protein